MYGSTARCLWSSGARKLNGETDQSSRSNYHSTGNTSERGACPMTNGDEIRKMWLLSDTPQNKTSRLFNN